MKTSGAKIDRCGFTLIELLAVIAIVVVLTAMLLPSNSGRSKAKQIHCGQNLKEVGVNFESWKSDHASLLPMQTSVTNGGSLELVASGSAIVHFKTLTSSNSLHVHRGIRYLERDGTNVAVAYSITNRGIEPKVLLCPSDRKRDNNYDLASLETLSDTNTSYFVGVDACHRNPGSILAGDRHLEVNQKALGSGLFKPNAKGTLAWSPEMHRSLRGGNLLFIDGHVEFVRSNKLNVVFQSQTLPYGRLAIP